MNFKFMVIKAGILLSSMSLANNLLASSEVQANNHFFSLAEIKNAPKKSLQPLLYIPATDDVALAYRTYLPQEAKAMLIFYHGAGAHSGLIYNHLATLFYRRF